MVLSCPASRRPPPEPFDPDELKKRGTVAEKASMQKLLQDAKSLKKQILGVDEQIQVHATTASCNSHSIVIRMAQ